MGDRVTGKVHSVEKAMALLDLLLKSKAPMTLREISEASGYPKSTAYSILSSMRAHGVIAQDAAGRYCLGVKLFEYGCAVSASWDITRIVHPYLEQLAALTAASSFVSLIGEREAITIDQCEGGAGLRVVAEVGSRLPLHATSQGKLLLAQMSGNEAAKRAQAAGLGAYTPHTITEIGRLLESLETIRENGYAIEDGEYKIGLRSVSAPIRDNTGCVRYAIGVVGLFRNVRSDEFQAAIKRTTEFAAQISRALGYHG